MPTPQCITISADVAPVAASRRSTRAQNPAGRPPPAGVQQRHAPPRDHEIDRNAVGDGDGEQHAGRGGDPAVDALDLNPASPGRPTVSTRSPCTWLPSTTRVEPGIGRAGRRASGSSLRRPARRSRGRGRIRAPARVPRAGDPGDDAEAVRAIPEISKRGRGPGRGVLAARCSALGSVIHALDLGPERAQPLVDPLVAPLDLADVVDGARARPRRAPRAASPCRRGCRATRPCRP